MAINRIFRLMALAAGIVVSLQAAAQGVGYTPEKAVANLKQLIEKDQVLSLTVISKDGRFLR